MKLAIVASIFGVVWMNRFECNKYIIRFRAMGSCS